MLENEKEILGAKVLTPGPPHPNSEQTIMVYGFILYFALCARTAQMDVFVTTPPLLAGLVVSLANEKMSERK